MNRIKKIMIQKQIEELRPSDDFLETLGVKINTWTKWVENRQDPELWQLPLIAEFLNCDVCDLIETNVHAKL